MHSRPQRPKKVKCIVLGSSGAGKTSIIRRYFYKTFDAFRLPTLGSDWHTARIPASSTSPLNGNDGDTKKNDVTISLQVWDTPGRERFDPKRLKPHQQQQQKPSPGASFLQQADGIMLVYDMTSSTSFIQLLKWYADLSSILDKRRPTLVVANKLDLQLQPHQNNTNNNQERVAQRDVLGLRGKYKGSDYHYEYQISRIDEDQENHKAGAGGGGGGSSDTINSHNNNKKGRTELTSYLADRENWTTDGSYLHSLITTEVRTSCQTKLFGNVYKLNRVSRFIIFCTVFSISIQTIFQDQSHPDTGKYRIMKSKIPEVCWV